MIKKILMLFFLMSIISSFMALAINENVQSRPSNRPVSSTPILKDSSGNPYTCKSIVLPDKELWEKCESEGLVVVQKYENGCVVGYDCGEPILNSQCAEIAPPSSSFCSECHNKGMIVKKRVVNGCVMGYVCIENTYMNPTIPVDDCSVDISCPPVKPAYDIVNSCESRGGIFTVRYNEKCEAFFECNFLSANLSNITIGCPIVDVPSDISKKCESTGASVVVKYDPNCNAKFFCKYDSVGIVQNNTNITGNGSVIIGNTGSVQTPNAVCPVDPELIKEFNSLVKQLREKSINSARDEDTTQLRQKIARLSVLITQQKNSCTRANVVSPQTGIAVGIRCDVPENLRKKLEDAWENYRQLLKSSNDVDLDSAKMRINQITLEIQEYRKKCMKDILPANSDVASGNSADIACEIPESLLKELEVLYKQYNDLQKSMQPSQQQLEEIKKKIDSLEKRLRLLRVRCNRLPIDNSTNFSQLSQYYAERLSEFVSNNPDVNIERLREIRMEIDENIKEMIAQRRRLRMNEVSEIVDRIKVTPNSVSVGDSFLKSEDVSIETQVDGSTVAVSSNGESVIVTQNGLTASASEVDVSENGIVVGESNIVAPGRLLEIRTLQRNRDRIRELTLTRNEDKIVYNAKVDARRKILGIVPATAKQEVIVDAVTGEVIKQNKPWWTAISTD